MRYGLTKKQHLVFTAIEEHFKLHAIGPSYAKLANSCDAGGRQNVIFLCRGLRLRGWIDWIPGHTSSMVILPDTDKYYPSQYNPTSHSEHDANQPT